MAVTKRRHHSLLLVFLVALSPVYLRVEVNTQSTLFRVKPRFCLMSSSFGCDGNSWSNAMISPLCFEFVSYVFLISGLNIVILFLSQTPLLYISILFQHIIIPEVSVLFVEFRSFFLTFLHFYCRILSRQTFTRFL